MRSYTLTALLALGSLLPPAAASAAGPLIYGYLSQFPQQSSTASAATVEWMNGYHIKYVQFYDWQWKQHVPLAGTVQSPAESWSDIGNRTIYRQTVLDLIAECHKHGMYAMNYNLLYGAYANYATDGSGVNNQWGLYNTSSGGGGTQWKTSLPASWAGGSGALAMFNPANASWQNYIFSRENAVFAAYGFDGWHVDQLGDPGLKYDYNGNTVDVWTTFVGFLNNAKTATGKRIVFNNVGTYGMFSSINQTANDAVYVECWPDSGQTTYNDLKTVIDNGLSWGNGKPVVLAAYINYNKTSGSFNAPGVLLCDAAIFASGGTHLELGDGGQMLSSEYFPNRKVSLSPDLAAKLKDYYNFITTYQDFLYNGFSNTTNAISLSIASANVAAAQKVWAFAKVRNGTHVLNFINLIGESSVNWRDDNGTYPAPTPQANFTVKYYYGAGAPNSVQAASPDINGGKTFQNLSFTTASDSGGNYVQFTVPSLAYWDLVTLRTSSSGAPGAPANLTAAAGDAKVAVSWNAAIGATQYNVKRAAASGGPYTTLANVSATSFEDSGMANGVTYYYVVSATNASGEGGNSAQIAATPTNPSVNWQQAMFGANWNDANVSADSADPDGDGVNNLIERGLNGNPNACETVSLAPVKIAANKLSVTFSRSTLNTDLSIAVQGSDSISGPWIDLARSDFGAAFAATASGATVIETGTEVNRAVEVRDVYQISDASHPTRFLRVQVKH